MGGNIHSTNNGLKAPYQNLSLQNKLSLPKSFSPYPQIDRFNSIPPSLPIHQILHGPLTVPLLPFPQHYLPLPWTFISISMLTCSPSPFPFFSLHLCSLSLSIYSFHTVLCLLSEVHTPSQGTLTPVWNKSPNPRIPKCIK